MPRLCATPEELAAHRAEYRAWCEERGVEWGHCGCRCGQRTGLAPQTHRKLGWLADEPLRFVIGHNGRGQKGPFRGKTHSLETRARISEANRGEKNHWWGKTHSPEARAKMSEARRGEKSHRWKGGRINDRNGYVRVLVGREHPMANHRGYCFEHRLVMAELVGRMLESGEQVHHVNAIRDSNDPENLWLFPDSGSHKAWHHMLEHGHELRVSMPAVRLGNPAGLQLEEAA